MQAVRLTGGFRILSQLSLPIGNMAKRLYSAYEVCAIFPGDSDDEIEMEVVIMRKIKKRKAWMLRS